MESHATIVDNLLGISLTEIYIHTGILRGTIALDRNKGIVVKTLLVHLIIHIYSKQRGHSLSRVLGLGKLIWSPIETGSKVPMLILLEWEHIDQELKVVDSRLANHLNLVLYLEASHILQHLRELIKTRLYTIAISIVCLSRLTTNLYWEVDALLETGHELVAGTELYVIANLAGYIDTNTGGTGGN